MSNRYFLKSSIRLLTLVLAVGAAQAQPMNPPDMGKMVEKHVERIAQAATASTEQKAQLLAIAKAAQADLKPLHDQARNHRQQRMALLSSATIDTSAIEQNRLAQSQVMDAISRRMTQSMIESARVLRPEQRAQLATKMKDGHERMGKMRRPDDIK
jgi:periplasmic protein CpxP/Spy